MQPAAATVVDYRLARFNPSSSTVVASWKSWRLRLSKDELWGLTTLLALYYTVSYDKISTTLFTCLELGNHYSLFSLEFKKKHFAPSWNESWTWERQDFFQSRLLLLVTPRCIFTGASETNFMTSGFFHALKQSFSMKNSSHVQFMILINSWHKTTIIVERHQVRWNGGIAQY